MDADARLRQVFWRAGCVTKGARPVRREAMRNLPPKSGKALIAYSTCAVTAREVDHEILNNLKRLLVFDRRLQCRLTRWERRVKGGRKARPGVAGWVS